jgi:two-component system, NtrC family, sensor kinase
MQSPAKPANERERQRALDDLMIFDARMEAAFDGLVRVAAVIADVPIALISLVDHDRQWFMSRVGIDATELPRELSFCGHVVADSTALVVPDAHADTRFADNPLVTGAPHVRFYAGMPLRSDDGYVLGTLCTVDHVPRTLAPRQLEALDLLAQQVVYLLNKRRLRVEALRDRARAETSARRAAALFSGMAEGVVVQAASGAITESNAAASEILGLSHDELRGVTSVDPRWRSIHEDGSPFPGETHPSMVALGTRQPQRNVVMGVHKPDGTLTWISINAIPVPLDDAGAIEVITTFHDISALKGAFAQISRQERLALTGTLVAGVGHEINTPLAHLMGNIDLVTEEVRAMSGLSPSQRMRDLLELLAEAREGTERIRRIVRGLRSLAREDVALHPLDLPAVVDAAISMAQHELRLRATLTVDLGELPPVIGDEARITQVLVNLLVNAAQSFRVPNPDQNHVRVEGSVVSGTRVRISVSDTGPGIDPTDRERIFDPFFTTKPIGVGTGLGLAVSRRIVQALGGELTVVSEPGHGSTFHLVLPVADALTLDTRTVAAPSRAVRGTVVVIDDDLAAVTGFARVLGREHDVRLFSDPREALEALRLNPVVDVVFCDLMMPHMTGQELYRELSQTHSVVAARFVFMTGGATRAPERRFLDELPNELLEKPFGMQELLAVARRMVLRHRMG